MGNRAFFASPQNPPKRTPPAIFASPVNSRGVEGPLTPLTPLSEILGRTQNRVPPKFSVGRNPNLLINYPRPKVKDQIIDELRKKLDAMLEKSSTDRRRFDDLLDVEEKHRKLNAKQ